MAAVWEGKKYENDTSENFDDYMKELGEWFFFKFIFVFFLPFCSMPRAYKYGL